MHAKFHAEALRLASNPLITRCLRAPARASVHTGVHNARHVRAAACVHASPVARCARLYLKAPERAPAAALLVLPLRTPARPASSLSSAAYLRPSPLLPLFNSFPLPHALFRSLSLSLSHSLSLAGWAVRDNFRWPGSTLPRSRCVSLSSSGFSKKYPSRGRPRHMHTLRYVNTDARARARAHTCTSVNTVWTAGRLFFFSHSLALTSPIAVRTTSFLRCARTHAHTGRARCFFSAAFCSLFIGNERVVRWTPRDKQGVGKFESPRCYLPGWACHVPRWAGVNRFGGCFRPGMFLTRMITATTFFI